MTAMKVSIRTKLIVAILAPVLLVWAGVLGIHYTSGRAQAVGQAEKHLTQLASHHAARLDGQFALAEQAARSIATLLAEPTASPRLARVDALLARNLLSSPTLAGACVILEPGALGEFQADPAGRFVYRTDHTPGPDPEELDELEASPGVAGDDPNEVGGEAGSPATRAVRPIRRLLDRRRNRRSGPPRPAPLRRGDLADVLPEFHRSAWYLRARNERATIWTDPLSDRIGAGEPVARCVAPILRDGEPMGAVAFDVGIRHLQHYVARTKLEGGYCLLVGRSGLLVAHPQREFALRESLASLAVRQREPALSVLSDRMAQGESGVMQLEDFHTLQPSWVVFSPVTSAGWSFAAVIPQQQIFAPLWQWFRHDMAAMLGGLGLIILIVLLVSIHITRPIGHLARAVRELGKGNLRAQVHGVGSRDELGEFARAFNAMVRALRSHVHALTRETAARKAVESELRVAREIQSSLLPRRFPSEAAYDLYAMNVPAKEVAGDFFDFFQLPDERLGLLIADVAGKGVPAALFMAMTRTVIRNHALGGAPPAEVLTRANRLISVENDQAMFVTLFFAHYHVPTGLLTWANAGHNPPCIGSRDGRVRGLGDSTGAVLGIFESEVYEQRRTPLKPLDSLVLYTDGVTEAMDANDRMFHLHHLQRIIAGNPDASPEEMCGLVVQSVEEYRAHPQQDDVTMMVLRRKA